MTDDELIAEMQATADELHRQSRDTTINDRELRITMRVAVTLIEKWIREIPAGD